MLCLRSSSQHFKTHPAFASWESESQPHPPKWCKTSRRLTRTRKLRPSPKVLDSPCATRCLLLSWARADGLWRTEDLEDKGLISLLLCTTVTTFAASAVPSLPKIVRRGCEFYWWNAFVAFTVDVYRILVERVLVSNSLELASNFLIFLVEL